MPTEPTLHDQVTARLTAAGCVAAGAEAADMVRVTRDPATLEAWMVRRESGEPLAWIIGTTRFCGHPIHVAEGVYVPRPQTEELARRAAAVLPRHGGRAVDLCTGSGAIAVHLAAAVPGASVIGTDLDEVAVRCARRNGVAAVVSDLGNALRRAAFDVVTVVAPYVPTAGIELLPADVRLHEPIMALDGGDDGLHIVRGAAESAARLLKPGGRLFAEVGGEQSEDVHDALTTLGFDEIEPWYDDEGDLRGIAARVNGRR